MGTFGRKQENIRKVVKTKWEISSLSLLSTMIKAITLLNDLNSPMNSRYPLASSSTSINDNDCHNKRNNWTHITVNASKSFSLPIKAGIKFADNRPWHYLYMHLPQKQSNSEWKPVLILYKIYHVITFGNQKGLYWSLLKNTKSF